MPPIAERSFFLFGPKLMYSLSDIKAVQGSSINPLVLRHFISSSPMGWKIAWSHRMISFYNTFPTSFYIGDALGSFNSIMRLVTGVLAALGLAWFGLPYVEASFAESEG